MPHARLVVPLFLLLGCALPIDSSAPLVDEESDRVLVRDAFAYDTAPESFVFVVDAGRPEAVLAALYDDTLTTGEAEWATPPWMTDDLVLRRDVDIQAVPLELLVRQGEPIVTPSPSGRTCIGYLGELSVIRMISWPNVSELAPLSEEEHAAIWDLERVGAPASERLADPAFLWDVAEARTYLVAEIEELGECAPSTFGAHPEHAPATFLPTTSDEHDAEAHRLFRAHPSYAEEQGAYDAWRAAGEWGSQDWPSGPWESSTFEVTHFEAEDGRALVVATAADIGCEGAPGALHVVYEVGPDGTLTHREDVEFLPAHPIRAVLEDGSSLSFITEFSFYTEGGGEPGVQDISPLDTVCGC